MSVVTTSPFPGLRPFREEESHLFFGREGQTEELLRRLERSRFLAVLGTSGSGKSSLVNAGLLPALRGEYLVGARAQWRVVTMRPGGDPLGRLAEKLAALPELGPERRDLARSSMALVKALEEAIAGRRWSDDANLLVVVDQFEEVFRSHGDASDAAWDARAAFVRLLIEAGGANLPLYVVMTMRSEYLGECAQFRELPETINRGQYLIPRLTREHWRAAIERPLRLMGMEPTCELTHHLLNDVARLEAAAGRRGTSRDDDADALPLLQHALNRCWFRFAGGDMGAFPGQVTDQHYIDTGGIDEALSRHLKDACDLTCIKLGDRGPRITERIFQRLRTRDAKNREVRDPVRFDELCRIVGEPAVDVRAVIDCFRGEGQTFLTPEWPHEIADSDEIDVTHECVFRRWKILCEEWIPAEEESRRTYLRLAQALDEKERVTGALLRHSQSWWETRQPTAEWAARYDQRFAEIQSWFERSVYQDELEGLEREQREADERRRAGQVRRLRAVAVWTGVAVVVLAIFLTVVSVSWRRTRDAEKDSNFNWRRSFAQLLAAKAQLAFSEQSGSRQGAALLALASVHSAGRLGGPAPIESRMVLASVVPMMPLRMPAASLPSKATALAASDDGSLHGVAFANGEVAALGGAGEVKALFQAGVTPTGITISRNGQYLVITSEKRIVVWDLNANQRSADLQCEESSSGPAALSPDNQVLFAPCGDLVSWRAANWQAGSQGTPVQWSYKYSPVAGVRFDEEGDRMVLYGEMAGSTGDAVVVADWRGGRVLREILAGDVGVTGVGLFPDLDRVAAVDNAGAVRISDVLPEDPESAARVVTLTHGGPVVSVHPSPDGQFIITIAANGVAWLWDRSGRQQMQFYVGRQLTSASFNWPDRVLTAAGEFGVARWRLWEPSAWTPITASIASTRSIIGDEVVVATASRARLIGLDGVARDVDFGPFEAPLWSRSWTFSPDGRYFARVTRTSELIVARRRAPGEYAPIWHRAFTTRNRIAARFSADARVLAVTISPVVSVPGGPSSVHLFDVEEGPASERSHAMPAGLAIVTVTSDGHVLARGAETGLLDVDPRTGARRPLTRRIGTGAATPLAISPDGGLLAFAETGGNGDPNLIRLVRWPDLAPVKEWEYSGGATRLAFSAHGELASATENGTIQVWSRATGEELSRLLVGQPVSALAFSPDGSRIVAVTRNAVGRYLWKVDALGGELCRRVDANLTGQEWDRFVPSIYSGMAVAYRCVCPSLPCR